MILDREIKHNFGIGMYVSAKVQILYNFDLFLHNEQQSLGTLSWVGSA